MSTVCRRRPSARTIGSNNYDVMSANYMEEHFAQDRLKYPKLPYIASESGVSGGGRGAWKNLGREHAVGLFFWGGMDYIGESHYWPEKSRSAGFIARTGFRTPWSYDVQSYFSSRPMVLLRPYSRFRCSNMKTWVPSSRRPVAAVVDRGKVVSFFARIFPGSASPATSPIKMTPKPPFASCALSIALAFLGPLLSRAAASAPPHLLRTADRVDLLVDGQPWLILGGELRNSSSSTAEFMQPVWPHLRDLHLNTVLAPVSWKQLEPQEGTFDFSPVDTLLDGARRHEVRLVLLWMGTWKNGVSGYAPGWVMTLPQRFPRLSAGALSPHGVATREADARAFAALLAHLRLVDGDRHTVIMVQVENEIGTGPDRSPLATAAFAAAVPDPLTAHLAAHEAELQPYVRDPWVAQGRRRQGTWREVFGADPVTDDIFHAWHYARYVDHIAAAGKAAYPLPMFVNACQLRGERFDPKKDPIGGPVAQVMDIWMAGAPAIDLYAVDNYRNFKPQCAAFRHRGNPLFIPEASGWWAGDDPAGGPAKVLYSFGEHHALAFSPFGIDNEMYRGHMLVFTYGKLVGLVPQIAPLRGTNRLHGFYRTDDAKAETLDFDGYRVAVTYREVPPQGATPDPHGSFGLIAQTAHDEFLVLARGATLRFTSTDPARPAAVNLGVEEGEFDAGHWKVRRFLNGDEVGGQGSECTLTPPPFSKYRVVGEEPLVILRLRMARIAALEATAPSAAR